MIHLIIAEHSDDKTLDYEIVECFVDKVKAQEVLAEIYTNLIDIWDKMDVDYSTVTNKNYFELIDISGHIYDIYKIESHAIN